MKLSVKTFQCFWGE